MDEWMNVRISRELRDIIHGYIMSDGHLKKNGVLIIDQSKKQKKFVYWLYKRLEILRSEHPLGERSRVDKRTHSKTYSYTFNTRAVLKGFHHMWYKPVNRNDRIYYKKILPKNIHCFFSIPFITVWFAGDGTKIIGQKGAKFEVTYYTSEERQKLKQLFQQKFNISTKILRAGQSRTGTIQWTLSITAAEYDKFRILITQMDLIPRIFPHKLCKKTKIYNINV
uniref:Homing endonuclease LAGLIDADG domain-containing protein n=1 Tax=Caulerpa verticillata TaxID=177082 RepID=A0A386B082_9CHLO|nr:hypothetical protein [Caulerpa verticillata]AYC65100.1 hypothetical protein [Caulerpa verticillata]